MLYGHETEPDESTLPGYDLKPAHGAPCNNCGWCCQKERCPLAELIIGQKAGACPAHILDAKGAHGCGLVKEPGRYRPVQTAIAGEGAMREAAILLIGSGMGCDARKIGERTDRATAERWEREKRRIKARIYPAMKLWGIA